MTGKDIIKCIKAAEMKLTKKEASALMSIPYKTVVDIAKKYGIKFIDGRQKRTPSMRVITSPASIMRDVYAGLPTRQLSTVQSLSVRPMLDRVDRSTRAVGMCR